MRLWHYKLLPYLPQLQFQGQLRELVSIMHDWRDKGITNHILINKVTEYDKSELVAYFILYADEYKKRYNKPIDSHYVDEFMQFSDSQVAINKFRAINQNQYYLFNGWHDDGYLKVCMWNLYEKYHYGRGKTKLTNEDWIKLQSGYQEILGEGFSNI